MLFKLSFTQADLKSKKNQTLLYNNHMRGHVNRHYVTCDIYSITFNLEYQPLLEPMFLVLY